jgi:uncharacterized membrane protein
VDDKHLHWVAEIGGKRKEWDAEIVEQIPDERIAWRSTSGAPNFGVVHFKPRDPDHTVVTIRLNYEPESAFEKAGALFGVVGHRVESDLKHFREFIEQRSTQTGAWRGEIHATDTANQERSQILREATPRSGTSGYGSSGQSGLT